MENLRKLKNPAKKAATPKVKTTKKVWVSSMGYTILISAYQDKMAVRSEVDNLRVV